jgi:Secretion system C-terminal sorting domain
VNSNSILSAPEDIFNFLNLSPMKRLFISLVLCLIAGFVMSQTIICVGGNAVFSGDSRPGAYLWTVESPNGAITFNGSVATIIDGFPLPLFGVATNSANNVRIRFNVAGRFRVRVRRFTSGIQRFENFFLVDVPAPIPNFSFTAPLANCGASFCLNGTRFPNTTLQWFRVSNQGVSTAIPDATQDCIDVQPPFNSLVLLATYNNPSAPSGCRLVVNNAFGTPPAGLGSLTLSDGGIGSPVCTSPATEFTATASFCNANTNGWAWSTSGQVQFLTPPTTSSTSVTFRLLSATGGGPANITVTNNGQTAVLNYNVLSWPGCDIMIRKPKDDNIVLPTSVKSESDKIAITDDPNSDLITKNTEGSNININKTTSGSSSTSTKAKIYPNPATNEIVIEDLQQAKAIRIFDVTGNFKEQINVGEESTMLKVNTSKYTNGMYLIQIQNNMGEVTTQKVQILK